MKSFNGLPSASILSDSLKPLAEARTLPATFYTSRGIFDLEMTSLFQTMWLPVCREEDVAQPGDFITREIGAECVLILRGKDNTIRAFYNVCRHRGTRLLCDAAGQGLKKMMCPYHAWTYELDGSLANAPDMGDEFDKNEFSLCTVNSTTRYGFVWINLDEHAQTLNEWQKDFADIDRYHMQDLVRGKKVSYEVNANWKIVCENYSECYHCALVHPQLNRVSDARSGRGEMERGACFNGGSMYLNSGFTALTMSGKSSLPVIPGLSDADKKTINYYVVYPNLLLGLHSEYVLVHTLWPVAPGKSIVECEWLYTAEAVNSNNFDPSDSVEFWDTTNRQDWGLCERVQLGAASKGYRPGPYNQAESCVHEFDRRYAELMTPLLEY